jgi:type II secretory pathway component PulJ
MSNALALEKHLRQLVAYGKECGGYITYESVVSIVNGSVSMEAIDLIHGRLAAAGIEIVDQLPDNRTAGSRMRDRSRLARDYGRQAKLTRTVSRGKRRFMPLSVPATTTINKVLAEAIFSLEVDVRNALNHCVSSADYAAIDAELVRLRSVVGTAAQATRENEDARWKTRDAVLAVYAGELPIVGRDAALAAAIAVGAVMDLEASAVVAAINAHAALAPANMAHNLAVSAQHPAPAAAPAPKRRTWDIFVDGKRRRHVRCSFELGRLFVSLGLIDQPTETVAKTGIDVTQVTSETTWITPAGVITVVPV